MSAVVHALGYMPADEALRALFDHMDVDSSGEVSFKEFATVLVRPCVDAATSAVPSVGGFLRDTSSSAGTAAILDEASLQRLFDFFDADGSEDIDELEMRYKLRSLGFDAPGASRLFTEMADEDARVITRTSFAKYLQRAIA